VVPAGQQPVHAVLQAHVFLLKLVERGEEGGDVKMAGLLHEKTAALFPVPLQQLFQGLGLAGRVQNTGHGVWRHPAAFSPPSREWYSQQWRMAVGIENGMCGNLVLQ
jgi:hypothetical protein